MLTTLEKEKTNMEQEHAERREVMKEHVAMQEVDILEKKSAEEKYKVTYLEKNFHALNIVLQQVNYV